MSIPSSLFRQYCFCPRIVYFQYILGLKVPSPLWVKQGVDYHVREQQLSQSRTLKRYDLNSGKIEFDVKLRSAKWGIHGLADAVIFLPEEALVIEFKLTCNKPTRGQMLQIAAYAVMIEEQYNIGLKSGFISYESKGKVHRIEIKEKLKTSLSNAIKHIELMQNTQIMPDSSASQAQCEQCEYMNFCNDRE